MKRSCFDLSEIIQIPYLTHIYPDHYKTYVMALRIIVLCKLSFTE